MKIDITNVMLFEWGIIMEEKKITGYAHIDKPWMKYYKGHVESENPKVNMTQYIKDVNIGRDKILAESYYGKDLTQSEFFSEVDKASMCLNEIGVKKGDVIMNLVPNVPESGRIWLGATQIGATSDFIDPRPDTMNIESNAKKVLEILKYEKANYIIALDICYMAMLRPIEKELKELGIDTIILLNASDSMNLGGKISYLKDVIVYNSIKNDKLAEANVKKLNSLQALSAKLKYMQTQERELEKLLKTSSLNIIKYSDLVKECNISKWNKVNDENTITYIGHTSGTSGARPKPITATNKQAVSTLEQLRKGNVNFDVGDMALNVLPFFAPFGAFDNYALNLSSGACNINVPEFDISEFGYLLKKYSPNVIMSTPAWLTSLSSCKYLKNVDLSSIKTIIYGGDSMTAQDEEKINEFLRNHGSNAVVEKGYGMSEFLGCGSYAQDDYNKPASIGIPLPETTFAIVNPKIEDKLVPVKANEKGITTGELAVSSDAVTQGIMNGEIIVPHFELDGKSYIRTRDIVDMDSDGVFYHQARKDRSFARFDGYKYKPYEVENIIEQSPIVKYVMVVDYFDENKRGIMPICHIVLNDEYKDMDDIEVVKNIVYNEIISNPEMSSRQIPSKFKIRESMPLSKNGKTDFNALKMENLDGSEINVDISETNLTVDNIEIYKNNNKLLVKRK